MNLQKDYKDKTSLKIQKDQNIKNIMAVPKLVKIVVNVGLGAALADKKIIDVVANDLKSITGQKPKTTRSKKSISSFKLRTGDAIGLKVTLRGKRMYDFLERLINVVLPRTRDFQGVSIDAFDGQGNYHLGVKEYIIFPEIDYSKVTTVRGLQISFITTTNIDEKAHVLFKELGMPFEKREQ